MNPHSARRGIRLSVMVVLVLSVAFLAACSTTQSVSSQVSDAGITSTINAKFIADPEVNPFEIDVDTQSGTVYLSGFVSTHAARAEAEDLAQDTNGVQKVVNRIKIGDMTFVGSAKDAMIGTTIKTKLAADPQVSALSIDVDVDRGVVTLKGLVRSSAQREEAARLARGTDGVKSVENLINVTSN